MFNISDEDISKLQGKQYIHEFKNGDTVPAVVAAATKDGITSMALQSVSNGRTRLIRLDPDTNNRNVMCLDFKQPFHNRIASDMIAAILNGRCNENDFIAPYVAGRMECVIK